MRNTHLRLNLSLIGSAVLPDDVVSLDLADEEPLDADLVLGDRPPVAVHPGHDPQIIDATSALFVLILT